MKKLSLLFLIGIILTQCKNHINSSDIELHLTGFPDSAMLYLTNAETGLTDSAYVINNHLTFNVDIDEPTRFIINTPAKTRSEVDFIVFWKESNKVTIYAEKGNLKEGKVNGSKTHQLYTNLNKKLSKFEKLSDSLWLVYKSLPPDSTALLKRIEKEGNAINDSIIKVQINYIKNNPYELYSFILLRNLMIEELERHQVEDLYQNLVSDLKKTKIAKDIERFIQTKYYAEIGKPAINFTLPDIKGNPITLDSLKGKVVLLDFWSSNCGPCLLEIPHLKNLYKEFNPKGFEIVGISMDKNKDAWIKTVNMYNITWPTVSDLKSVYGKVALEYGVNFYPTYYIIDRDGKVIDKVLGRGIVEEKIRKIFE
ncbi:TlpA disulfide reductase family protein [Tenuifilum thalassicum]|uniref:AhpC/TSA family protein n=1 Tax=Tenuifilum thalassicum TaxID=2590900 RepID=A0A7D4BFN3_9BACT|nr:TlpA disulfide reductase family protein [Tenuifilum thalassicum]QKG80778.1 AhpC/TSA family protein [Tenuifilum thalassicum]